jgi:hypothetical protein
LLPVLQGLRGRLTYRYNERDNSTPQADYDYVESDTFPGGVATNVPYGYKRQNASLLGETIQDCGSTGPCRLSAG